MAMHQMRVLVGISLAVALVSIGYGAAGSRSARASSTGSGTCSRAELDRAEVFASEAIASAKARRLPEALVAIDRGVEITAACSGSADQTIIARGSFALVLFRLNRFEAAERIAAPLVLLKPGDRLAAQTRDRLLLARIEAAAAQGDGKSLQRRIADFDTDAYRDRSRTDLLEAVRHFRGCAAHGLARRYCADGEDTILYGQYSGRRVNGVLQVVGQFDALPLVNPALTGPRGLWAFAADQIAALERARTLEREIAISAARWMDAVDRAAESDRAAKAGAISAAMAASVPLRAQLAQLAAAIDGFDQNAVSRFQPRALGFFVDMTNARMRLQLGISPPPELLRGVRQLEPLTGAAFDALLAGEKGVLATDASALVALLTAFQQDLPDEARAERIWRLASLSFGRDVAAHSLSFAEMRRTLDPDEMAVVTMLAVDSTGVVLAARREGPISIRELDPGIEIYAKLGRELLDIFGRPPTRSEAVPTGGAQLLYSRLLCGGERLLGAPKKIAFFLDSAAERFPMTLLARPDAGCSRDMRIEEILATQPREALDQVRWLGQERALRIVPFGAEQGRDGASAGVGYLGVAASLEGQSAKVLSDHEERAGSSGGMPALPGAMREIGAAADMFPGQATRLVGAEAREKPVRAALNGKRFAFVHFASHAVDAPFGLGVPAIVLSDPTPAERIAGFDGYLTPADIAGLRVDGATVLLSACQTARPEAGLGNGLVSGLAGAFIRSGASQVVVTYWRLNDGAAATVAPLFVRAIADGNDGAAAMHDAQLAYLAAHAKRRILADPYFWASYVAVTGYGAGIG